MTSAGDLQGNLLGSQKRKKKNQQLKLSPWKYLFFFFVPNTTELQGIFYNSLKFLAAFLLISSHMKCLIPPRMSQGGVDVNMFWHFPGQCMNPRVPC